MLALRLQPTAAEKDIVRILLKSLHLSIRRVISASFPQNFGDLMDRAAEDEMDESEEHTRKELKKEEAKKVTTPTGSLNNGLERRLHALPCNHCPEKSLTQRLSGFPNLNDEILIRKTGEARRLCRLSSQPPIRDPGSKCYQRHPTSALDSPDTTR